MREYRTNKAKRKLQEGGVATVVDGPNTPEIIDYLGQFGFEGMWIDTEHSANGWDQVAHMTRACDLWGMTSIVRVNANEPWLITRTLDVGATGIVVPHVNTREEAERVAKSCKYAPEGYRGSGLGRQSYGVGDYHRRANEETMVVVLLEEVEAMDNLKEILKVDGIDVFFPAPGDLAQSMGYVGQPNHPKVQAVVEKAIAQITDAGRVAGTTTTIERVENYIRLGARFFLTSWQPWVAKGAQDWLKRVGG